MALSLYSTPRLRKSEDSPNRYQVTHPSPVEKERAQASVQMEDDDSFGVAHRTRAAPAITVHLYLVALFYAKESQ